MYIIIKNKKEQRGFVSETQTQAYQVFLKKAGLWTNFALYRTVMIYFFYQSNDHLFIFLFNHSFIHLRQLRQSAQNGVAKAQFSTF